MAIEILLLLNIYKYKILAPICIILFSSFLICLLLWMLKITFFTLVLIRDKRTIFLDLLHSELLGNEWNNSTNMRERNPLIMIRRSSSVPISFTNIAEF